MRTGENGNGGKIERIAESTMLKLSARLIVPVVLAVLSGISGWALMVLIDTHTAVKVIAADLGYIDRRLTALETWRAAIESKHEGLSSD